MDNHSPVVSGEEQKAIFCIIRRVLMSASSSGGIQRWQRCMNLHEVSIV